jgi:hypothetical protein
MNIWALKKDIPLKILLLEIVHRYGENILTLNPDDPTLSAYIYTFGQNPKCYGIDLRYPIKVHNIVGENENLSLDKTIEVIAIHLFS